MYDRICKRSHAQSMNKFTTCRQWRHGASIWHLKSCRMKSFTRSLDTKPVAGNAAGLMNVSGSMSKAGANAPLVGRHYARMKLGIAPPTYFDAPTPAPEPAWVPDFSRIN